MKYSLLLLILLCLGFSSCKSQDIGIDTVVPKGYKVIDNIYGDLNANGQQDRVLLIKATDSTKVVTNRFDQKVDRNRRGIIVLLKQRGNFNLAVKNTDCFYSEHEDGGVYYAPQLSVAIQDGLLIVAFEHGRYGNWKYIFRYQNSDFELIEYRATRGGAQIESTTHINFETKMRVDRININEEPEQGEIFEEKHREIVLERLIKLSQIKDFEHLNMYNY